MWCLGVIQLIQHKYVGCEPWEGNERTIESVTYYEPPDCHIEMRIKPCGMITMHGDIACFWKTHVISHGFDVKRILTVLSFPSVLSGLETKSLHLSVRFEKCWPGPLQLLR
jgi:hypothetical protein